MAVKHADDEEDDEESGEYGKPEREVVREEEVVLSLPF
jgi:hypothetical protein